MGDRVLEASGLPSDMLGQGVCVDVSKEVIYACESDSGDDLVTASHVRDHLDDGVDQETLHRSCTQDIEPLRSQRDRLPELLELELIAHSELHIVAGRVEN